eukprot:TRINITY_DN2026_c0_g2_i4.p1 TRINITY_DN2026_c0_g2~~TRINITY_DN2026_c0_g2_i4.p1  ORF type:complete len:169 (-),score=15.88 TRINITY_DN2026_c0_g2_i4:91-597(-)
MEFMIELIVDVKHNKKKLTEHQDSFNAMKVKNIITKYLNKRKINTDNLLRITWGQLFDPQNKGRWWLVGSAWAQASEVKKDQNPEFQSKEQFSNKLLELARAHRMNSDIRRTVFCIMLGSSDYMECFESLLRLNLKKQEEREIVHVLMHCVQQVLSMPHNVALIFSIS